MIESIRLVLVRLIPDGSRVLVGFSGGADSTCLLHLLVKAGFDCTAAHLHHGLRPEADEEMAACEAFADSLGIPFVGGRARTDQIARDHGIGIEEAGRRARYEFFEQAAFRLECTHIATAHTEDDNAETVLLNLVRGTGLRGLGGIPEQRDRLIRPLLGVTRAETVSYCTINGLAFHNDPSNFDLDIPRVRIRRAVMPELEVVHPGARQSILRLGRLASEEDQFLDGAAATALEQSEQPLNSTLRFLTLDVEMAFERAAIAGLPWVLRRRALRLMARSLGTEIEQDQCERLAAGIAEVPRGSEQLTGGSLRLNWEPDSIHLEQLQVEEPFRYPITLPGETEAETMGWKFTAQRVPAQNPMRPPRTLDVLLDAAEIKGGLHFRSAGTGEKIQPLGMSGSKLLSDLFQEAGLTRHARRRLPIVCDLIGPVWVPGLVLADRVRLQSGSKEAVALSFGPLTPNIMI